MAASSADPVLVLRDCFRDRKINQVKEEDGSIIFPSGARFPVDTATAFSVGKKQNTSLLLLFYTAKFFQKRLAYIKKCKEAKIVFLPQTEVDQVMGFLQGLSDAYVGTGGTASTVAAGGSSAAQHETGAADGRRGEARASESKTSQGAPADAKKDAKRQFREIAMHDRNSLLSIPGNDFSFALKYYKDARAKVSAASRRGSRDAPTPATMAKVLGDAATPVRDDRTPIIVVPNTGSAVITLFNAKEFLQDGVFQNSQAKRQSGAAKPQNLSVKRKQPNAEYMVIDNPTKLNPKDWQRVVAVFALGKDWQFKNWKWSTPVELFAHVLGIFVKWEDEAAPTTVTKWNVKILSLSRNRAHMNHTASMHFWQLLDEFVKVSRPEFTRD